MLDIVHYCAMPFSLLRPLCAIWQRFLSDKRRHLLSSPSSSVSCTMAMLVNSCEDGKYTQTLPLNKVTLIEDKPLPASTRYPLDILC
jgi:hypothetical protein